MLWRKLEARNVWVYKSTEECAISPHFPRFGPSAKTLTAPIEPESLSASCVLGTFSGVVGRSILLTASSGSWLPLSAIFHLS